MSLVLLGSCAILWPLSYHVGVGMTRSTGTARKVLFRTAQVWSSGGVVQVVWVPRTRLERLGGDDDWWRLESHRPGLDAGLFRAAIARVPNVAGVAWNDNGMERVVCVWWWVPAAVTGFLPAVWLIGRARRGGYAIPTARCPTCG